MAYTLDFAIALGSSQTGLTLTAQLINTAGANVGSAITTGFTEIGVGNYLWHYAAIPDSHRGGVKFSAGSTLKAFAAINPEEAERIDADVSSRAAATGSIVTTVPVTPGGTAINLIRGDDYKTNDGRQLRWENDAGSWPNMASATVTLGIQTTPLIQLPVTIVDAVGPPQILEIQLARATTALLTSRNYLYEIEMVQADGDHITLVQGTITVTADLLTAI